MLNKTALTIGLSILLSTDATNEDGELAKEAIDSFLRTNSGKGIVTSGTLMTEGSATAGAAAPQNAPATGGAVELDKDGVPWDERIHSGSKSKTEKGVWKKRKGVDDAFYRNTTAMLQQQQRGNAAPIQTEQAAPAGVVSVPGAGIQLPGGAPSLPALQLQPVADPNYTELVALVGRGLQAGLINDAWVSQSLVALGVPDGQLQTLAHNPTQVATVLGQFKAAGLQ